jgi:hypothetical protein
MLVTNLAEQFSFGVTASIQVRQWTFEHLNQSLEKKLLTTLFYLPILILYINELQNASCVSENAGMC